MAGTTIVFVNENGQRTTYETASEGVISVPISDRCCICYVAVSGVSIYPDGLTAVEQMLLFGTIRISDLQPEDFRRGGVNITLNTQVDNPPFGGSTQKLFYDGVSRKDFLLYGTRNSDLRKLAGDFGFIGTSIKGKVNAGLSFGLPADSFVVVSEDCLGEYAGVAVALKAGIPSLTYLINNTAGTRAVSYYGFY